MQITSSSENPIDLSFEEKNIIFDSLTTNITSGILLIKESKIKYSNLALSRMTGLSPEFILNKKYDILFNAENATKVKQFIDEIEFRKQFRIEIELNSEGEDKTNCILDAVLIDSNDFSKGIICTFSDITGRKRTEEQLRQSEEFSTTILEAVSEALIGVNSNLEIKLFNTAAKKMFKRSQIEVIGKSVELLFPDIHRNIIKKYLDNYFSHDFAPEYNPNVIESEGIKADEETLQIEVSFSPANFRSDQLILLSIRDITKRKRYETQLKRKQQEQEALLNNIPDLVYFKGSNSEYISANKAFSDFVGIYGKEISGKTEIDVFPEQISKKHEQEEEELLKSKVLSFSEGILTNNIKKSIYTIHTRTPILDDDNNVIGIVGIIHDISERREKEIQLRQFAKELEEAKKNVERKNFELVKINQDLNLSRTELEKKSSQLETQNHILIESQNKLKSLNLQKDKFVSIISHDLRNPFTSILGHAELIQFTWGDTTTEKKLSYISAIVSAAKHQLNQLNNLVEWARFADGRMPFKPRLVHFYEIITKSLEAFEGIRNKKGIEIINNVDEKIRVLGDKNLLYRLFENLIGNSLKFTPLNGKVVITSNYIEDNNNVYISIKDSGIGIPPEILPSLFKLEGKTSRTGTSGEPGTGLGLILCREIVEMHHGNITVESKENEGATFTLNLPLASNDILVYTDQKEDYINIKECISLTGKQYPTIPLMSFEEFDKYLLSKFPSMLICSFSDKIHNESFGEHFRSNKICNLLPIAVFKDEDQETEKQFPENNVVQMFLKPLDKDIVSYNINKILI